MVKSVDLETQSTKVEIPPQPQLLPATVLFTIGSALASAAAVGVVFLSLIGRVSLFKSLGSCVITALVCEWLASRSEGVEIDVNKVVPTVLPKRSLREGDTFTWDSRSYYIAPTRGDGACGIHALMGNMNSQGVYEMQEARTAFAETLTTQLQNNPNIKKLWEEWMIYFVQDYLGPKNSQYSQFVFNEGLDPQLRIMQKQFIEAIEKSRLVQDELFREVWNESELKQTISSLFQNDQKFENDEEYRFNKLRESLNQVIEALKHHQLGMDIKNNIEIREKNTELEMNLYRKFVNGSNVIEAYKIGVSNSNYYFSIQELGLMAEMFQKHVMIVHEQNGKIEKVLDAGSSNNELVVIFHSGNHFSRCELLEDSVE